MKPTPENLAQIRVLYRNLDTLALWGIPYDMRADVGQQPRDIERARERNNDGLFRHHPSTLPRPTYQDPHEGWIWLGQPGWWGPYGASSPERLAIEAFLAGLPKEAIPGMSCEWTRLSDFPPRVVTVAEMVASGQNLRDGLAIELACRRVLPGGGWCERLALHAPPCFRHDYPPGESRCFNGNHPRGADGVCEIDGGKS